MSAQAAQEVAKSKVADAQSKNIIAQKQADKLSAETQKIGNEGLGQAQKNIIEKAQALSPQPTASPTSPQKKEEAKVSESIKEPKKSPVEGIVENEIAAAQEIMTPPPEPPASDGMIKLLETENKRQQEKAKIVEESSLRAIDQVKTELLNMDRVYKQYQNNPVTYRSALSNANFGKRVIATVLNLGRRVDPYSKKQTVDFVQKLVDEEVTSQKMARTEQLGIMKQRMNIYDTYLRIIKDERLASLATENTILEQVEKMLKINNLQEEQGLIKSRRTLNEERAKNLVFERQNSITQGLTAYEMGVLQDKAVKRGLEKRKLDLEEQKFLKKLESPEKVGTGLTPVQELERSKDIGGRKFLGRTAKDIRKFADQTTERKNFSKFHFGNIKTDIQTIKKAGYVGGGEEGGLIDRSALGIFGKNTKANFAYNRIWRAMKQLALGKRIEFTGGGNMSDYEQRVLNEFFSAHKSKFKTLSAIKTGRMENINRILLRANFYSELHEAESTFDVVGGFKSLSRGEQLYLIQKELGYSNEQMREVFKKEERKGKIVFSKDRKLYYDFLKTKRGGSKPTPSLLPSKPKRKTMADYLKAQGR